MDYTLKLTVQEINQLLQTLAKEPYMNVFEIISKIQTQANEQLDEVGTIV